MDTICFWTTVDHGWLKPQNTEARIRQEHCTLESIPTRDTYSILGVTSLNLLILSSCSHIPLLFLANSHQIQEHPCQCYNIKKTNNSLSSGSDDPLVGKLNHRVDSERKVVKELWVNAFGPCPVLDSLCLPKMMIPFLQSHCKEKTKRRAPFKSSTAHQSSSPSAMPACCIPASPHSQVTLRIIWAPLQPHSFLLLSEDQDRFHIRCTYGQQ